MTFELPALVVPGGRFDSWRPARPRYAVLDVDGTLVGVDGAATAAVVAAATAARAAGVAVGYATGRLPYGVAALHQQLALAGPHLLFNGAQVRYGGAPLQTWPLAADDRDRLLDWCFEHDRYAELYVDEGFWVTNWDERVRPHWEMITGYPRGGPADVDLHALDLVKATVVAFDAADRDFVVAELARLGLTPGAATSPQTPGMTYVNVTSPEAHKGTALRFAAHYLGIELASVVAVGDGDNDLEMLAVAGTAVAMGQASDAVRAAAHLIVPAVDADGAAAALRAVAGWASAAARGD